MGPTYYIKKKIGPIKKSQNVALCFVNRLDGKASSFTEIIEKEGIDMLQGRRVKIYILLFI